MAYIYRNFQRFRTSLHQLTLFYFSLLLLLLLFRLALFVMIGGFSKTETNVFELALALFTGFRFDTLVALAGMTPLILITFTELFSPPLFKVASIRKNLFRYFPPILLTIYLILSIVDLFFFEFFQSHLNILIFGFFEDDTTALLFAIWDDYPVIWILLGLTASVIFFNYITKAILKTGPVINISNLTLNTIMPLIVLIIVFIGIRGTISDNPLRMDATTITNNDQINALTCNGIYALKDAISVKKKSHVTVDIQRTINSAGFVSLDEIKSFFNSESKLNSTDDQETSPFFDTTHNNEFLRNNPPNVIFILCESLSSYYMSLHKRDSFNLLGQLEDVLPECIVFDRFLASTPCTIGSLENLMVNTVQYPLAQSLFLNVSLNTSVAYPYKNSGYTTTFITGGDLGWRNTGSFIKIQHFDQVKGYAAIKKTIDIKSKHQYGAYDEYLFDYLFSELEANPNQPQFIFALTITNHTPYTIPSYYKPYPLELDDALKAKIKTDTDFTRRSLLSFQYSNDCLGKLIKRIKESSFGHNTIIAITGDHNIRKIMDFSGKNLLQKHGVPFILYIPKQYQPAPDSIQTQHFGSHKDIFPTLYHLSLSNISFLKSGANMLSPVEGRQNFAISGSNIFMNHDGCVVVNPKKQYYIWKDTVNNILSPIEESEATDELRFLLKKGEAQLAAMDIVVQKNLTKKGCSN